MATPVPELYDLCKENLNAVVELCELCQCAKIPSPIVKFPSPEKCVVMVEGIGLAEAQSDVMRVAKQQAWQNLLSTPEAQNVLEAVANRYKGTDVKNQPREVVAELMVARAHTCKELLH